MDETIDKVLAEYEEVLKKWKAELKFLVDTLSAGIWKDGEVDPFPLIGIGNRMEALVMQCMTLEKAIHVIKESRI